MTDLCGVLKMCGFSGPPCIVLDQYGSRAVSLYICFSCPSFLHAHQLLTPAAVTRVGLSPVSVCLSVCLSVYPRDIFKNDAAKITKLDIQICHDESWKSLLFLGQKVTSHTNSAGVGLRTLVSAGFFYVYLTTIRPVVVR